MARRLGWTEDQIQDLAHFEQRDDFTPAEKAALRLAEKMTRDHHNVTDAEWDELRRHFDEGQAIELMSAIGLFNYFNRFADVLHLEPSR